MLKNVIQMVDSEHRKVHFLESDFFELAIRKCALSFLKPCAEFSEACAEFSEKCSFDVGIHDVFAHPAKPPRWGTSAGAGALGGAGRSPGEAGAGDPRRFRSKLTFGSDMAGI